MPVHRMHCKSAWILIGRKLGDFLTKLLLFREEDLGDGCVRVRFHRIKSPVEASTPKIERFCKELRGGATHLQRPFAFMQNTTPIELARLSGS